MANLKMTTQYHLNDISFKKFSLIEGGNEEEYNEAMTNANGDVLPSDTDPLPRSAYPLKSSFAEVLRNESNGDAIVLKEDVQIERQFPPPPPPQADADYWKLEPIYPENPMFLKELNVVAKLQVARRKNTECPSTYYGWPKIFKNCEVDRMNAFTLEDIAAAVNSEYPASIQMVFIKQFFGFLKGKDDRKSILDMGQPIGSSRDFIGVQVRIAAINTWSFEVVAPVNFMLKWHYGMPRPEEVAWLIANDLIRDDLSCSDEGCDLVATIKCMGLKSRKDFTAYNDENANENGSPTHPSFPAMHSAGSTLSTWLPALFKLTPEQYEEAVLIDHAVAMARTVAGVHYEQDNIAGLNVGRRIVEETLPGFVAENYGYDECMVKDRLEALSFDWKCFDSRDMTIEGLCVADFFASKNAGVRTIDERPELPTIEQRPEQTTIEQHPEQTTIQQVTC